MKLNADDILKMIEKRQVNYSVDGDNIEIEDDFLNSLLEDEKLKSEILALLKPKEPEFELKLTNAELLEEAEEAEDDTPLPRPKDVAGEFTLGKFEPAFELPPETKIEAKPKDKNFLPSWCFKFPACPKPVSIYANAVYYAICIWIYEYENFDSWFTCDDVCYYFDDKYEYDSLEVRQALRELAQKGHFFLRRNKKDEYSLIGDDDELAEFLRKEKANGKYFNEMCFYVPF